MQKSVDELWTILDEVSNGNNPDSITSQQLVNIADQCTSERELRKRFKMLIEGEKQMPQAWANFDEYVAKNWPKDVSEDCTDMQQTKPGGDGEDCLERNAAHPCVSCLVYSGLAARFAHLGRQY